MLVNLKRKAQCRDLQRTLTRPNFETSNDQKRHCLPIWLASMTLKSITLRSFRIKGITSRGALHRQASDCLWSTIRPYSSAPSKPERKLPQEHRRSRLKQWHRNLGIVVVLGGVAYLVYGFCFNGQTRDPFRPYKLVSKEPVSSTANIFVLEPQEISQDLERYNEAWQKGIWNVHFKQPQLQIVRPYTPLPLHHTKSEEENGQLRFLIRNDIHGEVSSYLHRLPLGSRIELRGPNLEYEISPQVKQIVFFAGGTGIAPALQVAHALFGSKERGKDRKLHILWASRKREDCVGGHSDYAPAEPLALKSKFTSIFSATRPTPQAESQGLVVRELEELKQRYPGKVTVEYFVNEENTWIDKDAVFKALSRFDDTDFSLGSSSPQERRQILISGPPGFISYLAGPKEWRGGKEQQGGVSKILAHAIAMNPHNVKVWKI
jgi:homoaconitate hydratase